MNLKSDFCLYFETEGVTNRPLFALENLFIETYLFLYYIFIIKKYVQLTFFLKNV